MAAALNDWADSSLFDRFHDGRLPADDAFVELSSIVEAGQQLTFVTCIGDPEASTGSLMGDQWGTEIDSGWARLEVRSDPRGDLLLIVLPTRFAHVVHLAATVPHSDYRWRKIERWLQSAGSAYTTFWLDLDDLMTVGRDLGDHGDVTVSRTTGRDIRDGSSISRGWRQNRPSFDTAVEEMLSYPASVRSVTLRVGRLLQAQVRRLSGATIYSGSFGLFQQVLLERIADAGYRRFMLLNGRERKVGRAIDSGLSIRVEADTFTDPSAVSDLAKVLYDDSELGVAVLHSNPYFHAAVTDYVDGSSFDVFITSPGEVVILPGYRSGESALSRLSDLIGERFASTSLRNAPASVPPTLEDLLDDG